MKEKVKVAVGVGVVVVSDARGGDTTTFNEGPIYAPERYGSIRPVVWN
jgi:hypothetical protein